MIFGSIINAIGGLATSYLDGKVAVQKANAQIKLKQATGELDWDIAAIQGTHNSWKDEWITLLFSIPLILAFCGDWGNGIVQQGFSSLEEMPKWYQYSLGGIVSASIGIRSISKFFTGKK